MIVAAGPTPFIMLIKHLEADAEFSGLISTIYPRLELDVAQQMPATGGVNGAGPFAIVREALDLAPPGQNHRLTFTIELHAQPSQGRKVIKRAAEQAEWILDERDWEDATESIRVPIRSFWQSTQGPYGDALYKTTKIIGQLMLVAH